MTTPTPDQLTEAAERAIPEDTSRGQARGQLGDSDDREAQCCAGERRTRKRCRRYATHWVMSDDGDRRMFLCARCFRMYDAN